MYKPQAKKSSSKLTITTAQGRRLPVSALVAMASRSRIIPDKRGKAARTKRGEQW
jgi:hypothetical protein